MHKCIKTLYNKGYVIYIGVGCLVIFGQLIMKDELLVRRVNVHGSSILVFETLAMKDERGASLE